jgi:hypothetical protein
MSGSKVLPGSENRCLRCRQPLPEGARFCVSCGFHNDADLMEKRVAAESEIERRKSRAATWRKLLRFAWFFRRW